MPATDSFLTAGGHRLETRWFSPARAGLPALVFMHQGLGSISMWRNFPEQLAARTGCGTLVYSRYGHGRSDVLKAPRPNDFMEIEGGVVLPEVLRALGLSDVILIGHSDGGTASLVYAAEGHPLRALAVVAPHILLEPATINAIRDQRAAWAGSVMRERMARHHQDVDAMFEGWASAWLRIHAAGWSIEPLLARIRCPVLAIQGVDDTHGTMVQIDGIKARVPGEVELVKLPDCGHDPFRDQTERMLELLTAFVARHST